MPMLCLLERQRRALEDDGPTDCDFDHDDGSSTQRNPNSHSPKRNGNRPDAPPSRRDLLDHQPQRVLPRKQDQLCLAHQHSPLRSGEGNRLSEGW
ncbi:hypothetical protein CGCA056_v002914 [Colletotrichum aenigma]|uniref:uncharacterized protein n=1 Tax=Colletotrichum aenigma TaxID=1215731 RepID=UPI0018724401|nr:uncharacterized protein CGCA056_v002914 [Colletotrichum aenigma]KAF5526345.1 hypothetical protein CGCA056_v002914 [Colletotrichum aenigma]